MPVTNQTELLSKGLTANGPSFGLGIPSMIIGITALLGGLGMSSFPAILTGIIFLLLAAFLMLSIDCIAFDKENKRLHLYKDYFFTTKGTFIDLNDFTSVSLYYLIEAPQHDSKTHNDYQLKTFEVHLTSPTDHILIKDFGDLEPARKLQLLISQKTGLTYIDKGIRETP